MRYWYANRLAETRVNGVRRRIPVEVLVFCERAQRDRWCERHEITYPCESVYLEMG